MLIRMIFRRFYLRNISATVIVVFDVLHWYAFTAVRTENIVIPPCHFEDHWCFVLWWHVQTFQILVVLIFITNIDFDFNISHS